MDAAIGTGLLDLVKLTFTGVLVPCFGYLLWRVYRLEKRVTAAENKLTKERLKGIRYRRAQHRLKMTQQRIKVAYGYLRTAALGVVSILRKGHIVSDYQLDSLERIPSVDELLKAHD